MRVMFLPVRRCQISACRAAFIGADDRCATCQREIASGQRASKRDIREHKRGAVRKRLGLPA